MRYVERPLRVKYALRFFPSRNMTDCVQVLVPLPPDRKFVPHWTETDCQVLTTEVSPTESPLLKMVNQEVVCIEASTALRRDATNNFEALVGKENRNAD